MASEMRRAAKALVERRAQSFRSGYPLEESVERIRAALPAIGANFVGEASREGLRVRSATRGEPVFIGSWKRDDEGVLLEGEFLPASRTQRHLQAIAAALTTLLAATAWAFLSGQDAGTKASIAVFTTLAILAFPYVVLGLSSQRSGREAALARVLQRTLALPER